MANRPVMSVRLAAAALSAMALALLPVPAPAQHAPGAGDRDALTLQERVLEPHRREAEMKNRAVAAERLLRAEATPNQALYDVDSYTLDVTLTPGTSTLAGTVTIQARVVGPSIATMDLDLRSNMAVSAATSGGGATTFSRVGDVLTVNLDRSYVMNEAVTVTVTYSGNPQGNAFNWGSHLGLPMIGTLSQPFGARDWWPCKDVVNDKADSVHVIATVPSNLIVASNGTLLSDVTIAPNRTFHWRTRYPTVPYLVSLAAHPFTVLTDTYAPSGGGSMPLVHYLFSDHVTAVSPLLPLVPTMLTTYASDFGEYPFVSEKYGHAEFQMPADMEHQTLSSMGFWTENAVAHELAHQWWGDMITCEDFSHVWLQEGFATWSEARWREVQYGTQAYRDYMAASAFYGPGTIFVEDPLTEPIFDGNLSYNKGGWVVHMLRGVLGDADFFQGVSDYRAAYAYGNATTEQFRDVMEAASGLDLDAFFQQWIYGEYFPEYRLTWSQNMSSLDVTIEQQQTTGLFSMPVPLRIVTTTGTIDTRVQNALNTENYSIPVTGTVLSVALDPDRWILHKDASPLVQPGFANGILLVNGVDWATYGAEITNAYNANAFWGTLPISFWDVFDTPAGGYPGTLPAPVGHGAVPADTIGMYSAIIWVGNNFGGDLARWGESPIEQYLEAGGNLLLMTRLGASFLDPDLSSLLGISWSANSVSLSTYNAVYPGLTAIPLGAGQSLNDVIATAVRAQSTLLFSGTGDFTGTQRFGVHA